MWTKDKRDEALPHAPQPAPQALLEPREPTLPERQPAPKTTGGFALIGRSISIHGEVTGDEDLLIQGRVQGSVDLKQHTVTVGTEGEVKADIAARVVTVEGRVVGNITGQEQVVLRASARVDGDIVAPRVVLEDGTVFRGSVEMGEIQNRPKASATPTARPAASDAAPASVERPRPAEEKREESLKPKAAPRGVSEVRA
jgi:cytoskeletal protein CcmA (bactofilin family)